MRILEILLPKGVTDRSISPQKIRQIDALQQRMNQYVDKILNPNTSAAGKEFLKAKLRDDYLDMKNAIGSFHTITEAVHKLPLTDEDFKLVKKMMENPIPAAIAPIYISEFIIDDDFSNILAEMEEKNPNMDVRPLIAEWFDRVMPDQMHRFRNDLPTDSQKKGVLSVIHGYDSKMYKGTNDPLTGNAYGSFM
jgi:hypothetical protein